MCREICRAHGVVDSSNPGTNSVSSRKSNSGCYKCVRDSHYASDCYAATYINGARLDSDDIGDDELGRLCFVIMKQLRATHHTYFVTFLYRLNATLLGI